MTRAQMFPAVLILLDLGAAVVYGLATGASECRDYQRCLAQ
jgi:hypothetical protein